MMSIKMWNKEERDNFLKYSCPVMIISLAICLGILNYSMSQQDELKKSILELSKKQDSLKTENQELRIEVEQIKSDKEHYIRLDVTGLSQKDGRVVVNNNMSK